MQLKHLLFTITFLLNLLLAGFTQEPRLLDHGGGVQTVEFSPVDASLVASAGESNIIKLWNLRNNTARTLRGHTDIVNSVAFSPDGELLASVSDDRTIRFWNVQSQQNIATQNTTDRYQSTAFSRDDQILATGGSRHVKLWNVGNRTVIATLQHDQDVRTVAFSLDGQLLAAGEGSRNGPGTVKVWNVQRRQVIATLHGDPKDIRTVLFSPDGRYLASSGWDGKLNMWHISDWTLLRTIPHTAYNDIAFSPDGKMIAGAGNGSVNLWWVEDGTRVASLPATDWRHPVDFSHDGAALAAGAEDGFVRIYNIKDIEEDIETRLQALQEPKIVRLIYFRPQDRPARPDRVTALRQLIKDTQQFYASEMERHGFGRKTFRIETDKSGEPFVHHVGGNFKDAYYHERTSDKVWKEITQRFDVPKDLYVCVIDISSEVIHLRHNDDTCGEASTVWIDGGKEIIMPASGHCFNVGLLAHELGHGFGLAHDFRNNAHVMSYGALRNELSSCAAEWLDASPFFNTDQDPFNMPFQVDKAIMVKMLPPIEIPPNGVRLRFEVNDSDGLHQAQLYIPTTDRDPVEGSGFKLHSCRSLSGEVSTLEFITTELPEEDAFARLRVMDVRGNFKWWDHYFPIQATDILRKPANHVGANDATSSVPETLQKISGDQQHGSLNNRLINPLVVQVQDADNELVAGVQVTFRVTTGGGRLSVKNPWTDSNGRAETFLTLGRSLINSVEASVSGVSEKVIFRTHSEPQVLITQSQRPPMYWVDTNAGTLHCLIGTEVENLLPSVRNATGLAVDRTQGKLYWIEKTSDRTGRIRHADLDGSNNTVVRELTNVPNGIALDTANGKLYITNGWGKVQRMNLDGSRYEPNLVIGLNAPKHIAIGGGNVYWTEGNGDIRYAKTDSSDTIRTLATTGGTLGGLAISGDKVYWTHKTGSASGKIRYATRDGSSRDDLATLMAVPHGISIDAAANKVYWSNDLGKIQRMNLDGSKFQDVVTRIGTPTGLVLGDVIMAKTSELIPDPKLAAVVRDALGVGENGRITKRGLRNLTELRGREKNISNLTGLGYATQLRTLSLADNRIHDLSPIAGLTELRGISLFRNQIRDLSPLTGLTQLEWIDMGGNKIKSIAPVEGLTQLEWLSLWDNQISDIRSLEGLTQLNRLDLKNNQISDISPIRGLTQLTELNLKKNKIKNVTPLAGLKNLNVLELAENPIADYAPLRRLKAKNPDVGIDIDINVEAPAAPRLPVETALLPNYPNPFNPETWIPYQLWEPAEVTLTIYTVNRNVVRGLALGHQPAGIYHSKSHAAYWDGKNELGETVASGVYFYTLSAGDFTATRKMFIRK